MNKKSALLIGFVIVKFLIQYNLISPEYDLHRDEYLHLDQANHLAWGYLSVPPVTSWFAFLIKLGGNSVFLVKFFPALFGALTIVVVWKAIEELKGNYYALILGATSILFSAILRLNTLLQPNSFDLLSWCLFYLFFIKYLNSYSSKFLYFAAITFGIGFLNKYNIAFLIIGFLPALLITKHLKLFTSKSTYFAILISLLIILPNLIWQYNNHFPVVHHMRLLSKFQLVKMNNTVFLKEQILFFIGSVFLIFLALIALMVYEPFKKYKAFFWSFFITILVYIYFKAKGYYAIGIYPIYIAFGSVYLEHILINGWIKKLRLIPILIPVLLFVPILKIGFPNKSPLEILKNPKPYKDLGLLRWEDGIDHPLPQDFADMQGWQEMAKKVDSAVNSIGDIENTIILADNYGQAGAINFYSTNKSLKAVSLSADYIDWFQLEKQIKHVVLVQNSTDDDPERKKEKPLFETVIFFAEISNDFSREKGTKIYVLKNAKADINKILQNDIIEEKKEWQ